MRIETCLSSADEQGRSAESRRDAKPEYSRFKWLTLAVGGALALTATAFCKSPAYAAPLTAPGEEAGLNAAAPLPEGVYFVNIYGAGGNYLVDDKRSNLSFDLPTIVWATPWQINLLGFTGRFEVIATPPIVQNLGTACLPSLGQCISARLGRDFTAMFNPFAEAGFAFDLGGGWSFSSFNGAYGPVDNELRGTNDIWTYNNRSWLGWSGNLWGGGLKDGGASPKFTFAGESVLGLTGNNLQTGQRFFPDYWNINLTAYATLGKWELGLISFGSFDLENSTPVTGCDNRSVARCEQSRWAVGPLVGYEFPGITLQAQYSFDVYDQNYRNLDGSRMQVNQFWLKSVIPLWTAPKLETSLK